MHSCFFSWSALGQCFRNYRSKFQKRIDSLVRQMKVKLSLLLGNFPTLLKLRTASAGVVGRIYCLDLTPLTRVFSFFFEEQQLIASTGSEVYVHGFSCLDTFHIPMSFYPLHTQYKHDKKNWKMFWYSVAKGPFKYYYVIIALGGWVRKVTIFAYILSVKFKFSEKATKICAICLMVLTFTFSEKLI